jgi:hypothetical protein
MLTGQDSTGQAGPGGIFGGFERKLRAYFNRVLGIGLSVCTSHIWKSC